MADLITIALIAEELSREPDTVKRQLQKKGISPQEYAGPTGMYPRSVIEAIRVVPPVGRPKKTAEPQQAKKKQKKKETK